MAPTTQHKLLRRKEVESRTGLSKSTMYQLIASDEFPKQIRIGKRSVFWLEADICNWINEKAER